MAELKIEDIKFSQFIKPKHYVRTVLGLILAYLVYTETGIWTGISIALIMVGAELENILYQITDFRIKQNANTLKSCLEILQTLTGIGRAKNSV